MSDYLGETVLFKKINSQEPMYVASAVDTLINGLSGDYYTKTEIDDNFYDKTEIDNKIASVYHFKGSVENYQALKALPSAELAVGDVYNVTDSGKNYAWTAVTSAYDEGWDVLGGTFDLDNYYTKDQADALLSAKVDKVEGMGLSHNDFTDSDVSKLTKAYGFTISGGLVPGNSHENKLGVGESDYNFTYMAEEGLHVGYREDTETIYENGYINRNNEFYINLPSTSGTLALTSDISSAVSGKVDKVEGMGLSHNDFTDEAVAKVNGAFQTSGGTVTGIAKFNSHVYVSGGNLEVSNPESNTSTIISNDRIGFATTGQNFKETQYRNGNVFFDNGVTESVISIPAKSGTFALVSDIATETSGKADNTAFEGMTAFQLVNTNSFDVEELALKYNTLVTVLSGIAATLNP